MKIPVFCFFSLLILSGCANDEADGQLSRLADGCWIGEATCIESSDSAEASENWSIRLTPDPELDKGFYLLEVSAPESFEGGSLLSIWEGKDMYMGKLPVALAKTGGRNWKGVINFPTCAAKGEMVWQLSLESPGHPIALKTPLLVRADS